MLIDSLKQFYHERANGVIQTQPAAAIPVSRSAANADRFDKTGKQARRQRRLRRLERSGQRTINGWTVRAW